MRHGSTRSHDSGARLLDRVGIRSVQAKVTLLAVAPLALVVAAAVPLVLLQVSTVSAADAVADNAARAQKVGALAGQLQRESVLTAAYVADPSATDAAFVRQQRAVDVAVREVPGDVRVGTLAKLRQNALGRKVSLADVASGYDAVSVGVIDALGLTTSDKTRPLDALLRANEQRAARATALIASTGADRASQRAAVYTEQFAQLAGAAEAAKVTAVEAGPAGQQLDRLAAAPGQGAQFGSDVVSAAQQLADQRGMVQDRLMRAVADDTAAQATVATRTALLLGGGAIVLFGLITALSVLTARSVSRPLRTLATQARSTADLSRAEFARVGEGEPDAPRRAGVQLLAGAAKRTQNLVGGQRTVVDELTRAADDPVLLAGLRRLDHAALRLRRTADGLLVVSGSRDESRVGGPIELATALRSAAAEIEDEARVQLGEPAEVLLAPSLGIDLVLLFAELLENAAAFSPPESEIEVATGFGPGGELQVTIADHGIGLPEDRLAAENRRLAEPAGEPSGSQLGLAVVARLARRHSLGVELAPGPDGGVIAQVTVPQALFTRDVDFRHEPEPVGLFEPGQVPDPRPLLLPAPAIAALSTPTPAGFGWFADPEPAWPETEPDEDLPVAGTLDVPAEESIMDTVDTADPSPTQRFTPVAPETRDGVVRRVPGAQLAPALRLPQIVRTPLPRRGLRDPAAERATFDAFSDGVAKAQQATAARQADQGGS
ncbi:sensor histidine kinase [Amycolatopsis jejuensis]|uniref:sensor histidine kinase n=1 Tax=Amycolatopsis jejuensis TaxID=330084 RepID=UPI000524FC1D|nr:ATP-binding protein [Amycolatopsis jejuensis]